MTTMQLTTGILALLVIVSNTYLAVINTRRKNLLNENDPFKATWFKIRNINIVAVILGVLSLIFLIILL